MAKYIFCILACAFLVLGFSNVSDKELQGFQKETGISANDMQYKAESCCEKMSLSKMTFSHQMARLIFVEQLYRAMNILNGGPYHHE